MNYRQASLFSASLATAALMMAVPLTAVHAQIKLPGGLGGALGGGGATLPGLGSASAGNVTGLLSYCVKNKIVSRMGANGGVLASLQGRPDAVQSPDYKAGIAGNLLGGHAANAGNGSTGGMLGNLTGAAQKPLSLDSLPTGLRTKACDMILNRAKSLL